uniref:Uncharacterized protein n=1 Tax=Anguilla anguilla TaxID=7936 RepID=A0A0E9T1V6_ANGAN
MVVIFLSFSPFPSVSFLFGFKILYFLFPLLTFPKSLCFFPCRPFTHRNSF